jgi:phosphate transport system protein
VEVCTFLTTPATPHLEALLQQDLDDIRTKLVEMADLGEQALCHALQAVLTLDRQLAYSVILGDRHVDELETALDRKCLEFLLRHQPAGGILRFVYSTSKIIKELERIGDLAVDVARQALQVATLPPQFPREQFEEIARLAVPMVRDAVRAFVDKNADLARATMELENDADQLRNRINDALVRLSQQGQLPAEALSPLLTVARRFERTADQAYNICEEALYYATGEYLKHRPMESFRIIFVGETNTCLTPMAEGIAQALGERRFHFSSAGLIAGRTDPRAVAFMQSKGIDLSQHKPQSVDAIPDLDQAQVIIGLCREARKVFPNAPTKTVGLEWHVLDPSKVQGDPEQVQAAYETAYDFLKNHIRDLVQAILGERRNHPA